MENERPSIPPDPYVPGVDSPSFEAMLGSFPRPKKFQHRYRKHIVLFLLTLFTTSYTPVWYLLWGLASQGMNPLPALTLFTWPVFVSGLWYAVPVLLILSAHEFGHYFACRYHNVDATLPYFIPAPVPLTGTFGAVIRIRELFPSKRALFDIGVAGPIGGFLVLVPVLWIGLHYSSLATVADLSGGMRFGEPLLFKAMAYLRFGPIPAGQEVALHSIGFAAWFGMLATALNLMPFGQLDGGHIMYSVLGRRAAFVSLATLAAALVLLTISLSWIWMTAMLFLMAYFMGVRHPPVVDQAEPLGTGRKLIAVFALLIFIGCFIPIPIDVFN